MVVYAPSKVDIGTNIHGGNKVLLIKQYAD